MGLNNIEDYVGYNDISDVKLQMASQSKDFSCGVSAMLAVLHHYNKKVSERELFKRLECTPENGVTPLKIIEVAKYYGLKPEFKQLTTKDVQKLTDMDIPIILMVQSRNRNYDYDDGHYIVAVGYDKEGILVYDPLDDNKKTRIRYAELPNVWYDWMDGKMLRYYGIVVK